MTTDFENHCWADLIPSDVIEICRQYARNVFVGPAPPLLAIDLYELAYQGGARPPVELQRTYASSCGEHAHAAIGPTKRLFATARAASLPVFYITGDTRPDSVPSGELAVREAVRFREVGDRPDGPRSRPTPPSPEVNSHLTSRGNGERDRKS